MRKFLIVAALLAVVESFIVYPFIGQSFVDQFLQTLKPESLLRDSIPGAQCLRPCTVDDQKVCHFQFTLENYQVMGG